MPKITERAVKIAKTTNLYLSFFALGMCIAVPGPTLLDLEKTVNTDTKHIAFIYTCRSTGYLLGSLVGGIVFDFVKNKQPLLILVNFLMSVSALATPWCRSLGTLTAAMAGGGIAMGAIDTGGNVLCLNIWGKDCAPYFQALHFAFGLGGFAAPLIVAPFTSSENLDHFVNSTDNDAEISGSFSSNTNTNYSLGDINNNSNLSTSTVQNITYPYSIIGAFCFVATLSFILVSVIEPRRENSSEDKACENVRDQGNAFVFVVVLISSSLIFVYAGIEIGFSQMISTYAVKGNLKLSQATGSFLTSVLWGTFTFSRGASIFLAMRFSCVALLLADLVTTVACGVFLLTLGVSHETCLWTGTAILGVGLASFYASLITWVENYIVVSNKIASTYVLGGALGEMVVPFVISQYVETVPEVLFYAVICLGIIAFILFTILWAVLKSKGAKRLSDVKAEGECNSAFQEEKV